METKTTAVLSSFPKVFKTFSAKFLQVATLASLQEKERAHQRMHALSNSVHILVAPPCAVVLEADLRRSVGVKGQRAGKMLPQRWLTASVCVCVLVSLSEVCSALVITFATQKSRS